MEKRVNNALKGLAGAGIALGGVAAFGEADVIYAQEYAEQQSSESSIEEYAASETYQVELTNFI